MTEIPPNLDSTQRKRKPPRHFMEDEDKFITKKSRKATLTVTTPTTTQSSAMSDTGSTKSQNKIRKDTVSSSPPCAQPRAPKGGADNCSDDPSSQKSNPETIEVSDGESSNDDVVEVVEENDEEELGECGI